MNTKGVIERYKNILNEEELAGLTLLLERLSKEDPEADFSFAVSRYVMSKMATRHDNYSITDLKKLSSEEIEAWLANHIPDQNFREELYSRILQEKGN